MNEIAARRDFAGEASDAGGRYRIAHRKSRDRPVDSGSGAGLVRISRAA
jgi:hypothetical protein